jgi:hypothetical protein
MPPYIKAPARIDNNSFSKGILLQLLSEYKNYFVEITKSPPKQSDLSK